MRFAGFDAGSRPMHSPIIMSPTAQPSPPSAARGWSLVAAIACVTTFGVSIGQGSPLLSLTLEQRGVDATLNGMNAGAGFVGVMLGPLLMPRGVRLLGVRRFLLACLACDIVAVPLLRAFDSMAAWFAIRILLGVIGSSMFAASEAWIIQLAGTAARGRVLGLYAAALSGGLGVGPLLLTLTGIAGWPPFLLNAAITSLAALPLLTLGGAPDTLGQRPGGAGGGPLRIFVRAPLIVGTVAMFALYEQALLTLLPVWGMRSGLGAATSSACLSAVFFGSIAMQWPIGVLSDRVRRVTVLRGCAAVGLAGALLLALAPLPTWGLWALLFVWGGIAAGIYPVALGMAGDRFAGPAMVAANAAIIMAYGLGSLGGPSLGGMAMDWRNPDGLLGMLVAVFAVFLLFTLLARSGPPRRARGVAHGNGTGEHRR